MWWDRSSSLMDSGSKASNKPPPPSEPLLALQQLGFELTHLKPSTRTSACAVNSTTTPSASSAFEQPPEYLEWLKKRSSSIYSDDTTITNILHLYGYDSDSGKRSSSPYLHHPKALNNTVAPLLLRQLSRENSVHDEHRNNYVRSEQYGVPAGTRSIQPEEHIEVEYENRNAVAGGSESLSEVYVTQNNRDSCLSTHSKEQHLQNTFDKLQSQSSSRTSNTPPDVSYANATKMDRMSHPATNSVGYPTISSPLYADTATTVWLNTDSQQRSEQLRWTESDVRSREWQTSWSTDSFVMYSTLGEIIKAKLKEKLPWSKHKSNDHRKSKLHGDNTAANVEVADSRLRKFSLGRQGSLARLSRESGISNLVRAMSLSSRAHEGTTEQQKPPRRRRQVAIPQTPYQLYGPEIWTVKAKKQRQREREARSQETTRVRQPSAAEASVKLYENAAIDENGRPSARDIQTAFNHGQTQLVTAMEAAREKLTSKLSQRRRKQLKASIVLLGSTSMDNAKESTEREIRWL